MSALPNYQTFLLPALQALADGPADLAGLAQRTAQRMDLPQGAAAETLPWNGQPVLEARVEQAVVDLDMAGLVARDDASVSITERGRNAVAEAGGGIDLAFLGQFPEFAAYRAEKLARRGA